MFTKTQSLSFLQSLLIKLDHFRLRIHFKVVEQRLKLKEVSYLPKAVKQARENHIRRLRAYGERGIFPRNETHLEFRPCFVDQTGSECAVAHLLIESGEEKFAQHIVATNNPAFVREMFYPELDEWAKEAGITKKELQMIQPMYPPTPSEITLMHLVQLSVQLSGMVIILGITGFLGITWKTLMPLKDKGEEIKPSLLAYFSSPKWKAIHQQDTLLLLLILVTIGILAFYSYVWVYPQAILNSSLYNESVFYGYLNEHVFHPVFQTFLNKLLACDLSLITLIFLYWGQIKLKSQYPHLKIVMLVNLVLIGAVVYWMTMNYIALLPFNPLAYNNVWYFFRNPVIQCLQDPTLVLCP